MALQTNASMKFISYDVVDTGISMRFECANPGPGQETNYTILLTDTELASATTQPQLQTLVTNKLQRRFRATNIATKLDPFIGQSIVI